MIGLSIPVRAFQGRAVLEEGDREMAKVITLAVSDRESTNPWNGDAGIRVPLFNLNNSATRAILTREIQEHFTRWEGAERARLLDIATLGGGSELSVRISYQDMETDRENEVSLSIGGG